MLLVRSAFATLSVAMVAFAAPSSADSYSPPSSDHQAVELHKLGHERGASLITALGKKLKTGHAEVFVNAPIAAVRSSVLDYANYQTVIPKFQKAKLLKRSGATADVYLQIPILNGAATVWTVQHFDAPSTKGSLEWIDGTSVQGNVDALRTRWTYRAVDATHTILTVEIYAEPRLPPLIPKSAIEHEVEGAATEAVASVKSHTEAVVKKNPGVTP